MPNIKLSRIFISSFFYVIFANMQTYISLLGKQKKFVRKPCAYIKIRVNISVNFISNKLKFIVHLEYIINVISTKFHCPSSIIKLSAIMG